MRQYLDCGGGDGLRFAGRTESGADLVGAGDGGVTGQGSVGEVVTLLGVVLDEGGRAKVGLRDVEVEDGIARRDVYGYGQVDTVAGNCWCGERDQDWKGAGKHRCCAEGGVELVEGD